MRDLLNSDGLGLVILGEVLRDIEGIKMQLATTDLTHQEGVQMALRLQGEIKGLNRVVDRLFSIADGDIN